MIQIQATYAKKLGLPNYSSHSFMVSVSAEVSSLRKLETETKRVYALLQSSVDEQLKGVGFVPDATKYGMIVDAPRAVNGASVRRDAAKPTVNGTDAWACSDKQRAFIEMVAKREKFTAADLDGFAERACQLPVRKLDKRQASRFIDELLKISAPPALPARPKAPYEWRNRLTDTPSS